ncbi:MAG: hypothetical protein CMG62_01350 [Candidatus Marinimicrobia bacterium]|nr:hypothetical protein [Candidatus Neomarinimicrobiota bacterium]
MELKQIFFKKNKKDTILDYDKITPIEAVTYLFVFVMLSDNQNSYEEKESWKKSILKLFPNQSDERSEIFFNNASKIIPSLNSREKDYFLVEICKKILELLDDDKIKMLGPMLSDLIMADGIIMSTEVQVVNLIEKNLSISIDKNE